TLGWGTVVDCLQDAVRDLEDLVAHGRGRRLPKCPGDRPLAAGRLAPTAQPVEQRAHLSLYPPGRIQCRVATSTYPLDRFQKIVANDYAVRSNTSRRI